MAPVKDQSINECKASSNICDLENSFEMGYTTEDDSADSETDTEEEFAPEMISQWDCIGKRLESSAQINLNKAKVERRPTRKPDPKTCNRNALMARENRKKKKEYVQKLENSILQYLKTQKNLQKIVKKQSKFIQKLQNEKRYYKNILSNKSEILSLVSTINQNSKTQSSDLDNCGETPENSPSYSASDCFRSDSFSSQSDYPSLFDDDLNDYNSNPLHENWDNLDYNDSIFSDRISDEKVNENEYNFQYISDEHNYVNVKSSNEVDNTNDVGVCLHINRGKISLEFCPKCNLRSTTKLFFDSELDVN